MSGLKDERLIRKQTYKKTEAYKLYSRVHYFCQISSKLILIMSSYTVSNFTRFLRHSVESNSKQQKAVHPLKIQFTFAAYYHPRSKMVLFSVVSVSDLVCLSISKITIVNRFRNITKKNSGQISLKMAIGL